MVFHVFFKKVIFVHEPNHQTLFSLFLQDKKAYNN